MWTYLYKLLLRKGYSIPHTPFRNVSEYKQNFHSEMSFFPESYVNCLRGHYHTNDPQLKMVQIMIDFFNL